MPCPSKCPLISIPFTRVSSHAWKSFLSARLAEPERVQGVAAHLIPSHIAVNVIHISCPNILYPNMLCLKMLYPKILCPDFAPVDHSLEFRV